MRGVSERLRDHYNRPLRSPNPLLRFTASFATAGDAALAAEVLADSAVATYADSATLTAIVRRPDGVTDLHAAARIISQPLVEAGIPVIDASLLPPGTDDRTWHTARLTAVRRATNEEVRLVRALPAHLGQAGDRTAAPGHASVELSDRPYWMDAPPALWWWVVAIVAAAAGPAVGLAGTDSTLSPIGVIGMIGGAICGLVVAHRGGGAPVGAKEALALLLMPPGVYWAGLYAAESAPEPLRWRVFALGLILAAVYAGLTLVILRLLRSSRSAGRLLLAGGVGLAGLVGASTWGPRSLPWLYQLGVGHTQTAIALNPVDLALAQVADSAFLVIGLLVLFAAVGWIIRLPTHGPIPALLVLLPVLLTLGVALSVTPLASATYGAGVAVRKGELRSSPSVASCVDLLDTTRVSRTAGERGILVEPADGPAIFVLPTVDGQGTEIRVLPSGGMVRVVDAAGCRPR